MMDMVDWQVITKFADTPFVIEAPITASNYAARAAKILNGARIKVNTSDLGEVPYRNALDGVRKQVENEFAGSKDRIEFFDMSQKDFKKEAKRIDKSLVREADGFREEVDERGAVTFGVMGSSAKPICVVVGPRPNQSVREFFHDEDGEMDISGVSREDLYKSIFWHELGHCLLGGSENKADTFSALMTIRHSDNRKILPMLATWRELDEWSSPEFGGDYFISKTLWNILAVEDRLRNSPKFMSMGMKEIASLANELAEEFGLSNEEIEHRRHFRVSLNEIGNMKAHYIPVESGVQRVAPEDWVTYHAQTIPEFARLKTLSNNLMFGAVTLKPFETNSNGFKSILKEMSKGGDKTASAMLRDYTKPHKVPDLDDEKIGPRIGFRPATAPGFNEIIEFKKESEQIRFSQDNNVWVVQDKATGDIVGAGSISLDRRWGVKGYDPSQDASLRFASNR